MSRYVRNHRDNALSCTYLYSCYNRINIARKLSSTTVDPCSFHGCHSGLEVSSFPGDLLPMTT